MTRRVAQLADLMHQETGKPHGDAMLEAALAIDHLAWAAGHAGKVLAPAPGLPGAGDGQPGRDRGVPPARRDRRDRPVELPGLHADGLDRLRPGRRQRGGVQAQRVHARASASGWPGPSARPSGARCSRSSPASARPGRRCAAPASTRSPSPAPPATGKRVMAACAETLTPVSSRPAARTPLLVDEDADLDAAADAALWGACSNAGQTCTGVERVYVHERVYDDVPRLR